MATRPKPANDTDTVRIKVFAKPVTTREVDPTQLHTVIEPCQFAQIRFRSERELLNYRKRMYDINKNNAAGRRYRSEREHGSSLLLYVWRMS